MKRPGVGDGRSREAVVLVIVAMVIVGILSRRPSREPWNFEPVMDGTAFLVTGPAPPARRGVGDPTVPTNAHRTQLTGPARGCTMRLLMMGT